MLLRWASILGVGRISLTIRPMPYACGRRDVTNPRKQRDSRFPVTAIRYSLAKGGIGLDGVDQGVFYDKPFLKFEWLVETYLTFAPRGIMSFWTAISLGLREKLLLRTC